MEFTFDCGALANKSLRHKNLDVRSSDYKPVSWNEKTKEKFEQLVADNQIWLLSIGRNGWAGHIDCNPILSGGADGTSYTEKWWPDYDTAIFELCRDLLGKSSNLKVKTLSLKNYILTKNRR